MQIIIDPRIRYNYASYYLLGIEQLCGCGNIKFDVDYFKELDYSNTRCYNSGMAFVVKSESNEQRIFVDFEDVSMVFEDRYMWCDVYGMANPTKDQLLQYDKMIAIGPEFSVTLCNRMASVVKCISNYLKSYKYTSIPFKVYLRDYLYTNIRRRKVDAYVNGERVKENYIFHASTLWYNNFASTDTNFFRGAFLQACKKAGMMVEGGLFYIDSPAVYAEMPNYSDYLTEYKDFICKERFSMDEYLRKTKESVVVFNTPSVCECHGWKLGEYLCMGKAIISTPLTREMPGEGLTHGKNIHFVSDVNEIYDSVVYIKDNPEYRMKLEKGAKEYYERYLAPKMVISKLLSQC